MFSESSYSVAEVDGQVEVCVNVMSTLERTVTVEVETQDDGGAKGEWEAVLLHSTPLSVSLQLVMTTLHCLLPP